MKKGIILLLCICLCLTFVGCKSIYISSQTEDDEDFSESTSAVEEDYDSETSETDSTDTYGEPTPSETDFKIEGKWKSVGEKGFGQAQPGSIVIFNGTNCNFFSPQDTYAFYRSNGKYILDCTSYLFSQNLSFEVEIIDNDNIIITRTDGNSGAKLMRLG